MAPCGSNTITPTLIKNGVMKIGDRIEFEEVFEEAPSEEKEDSQMVSGTAVLAASPEVTQKPQRQTTENLTVKMTPMDQMQAPVRNYSMQHGYTNTIPTAPVETVPLVFDKMTNYSNSVHSDTSTSPSFNVPNNPLVPPGYSQTLDYDSLQYMNGFLRTQVGRYIQLEQLVGSNTITQRNGFLIGVGTNYIVLQEIATGNIMTLDVYSIKYIYIYYGKNDMSKTSKTPET